MICCLTLMPMHHQFASMHNLYYKLENPEGPTLTPLVSAITQTEVLDAICNGGITGKRPKTLMTFHLAFTF